MENPNAETTETHADASPMATSSPEEQGSTIKIEVKPEKKSFPGVNLYVKNLDDTFSDEKLREVFKEFGSIISTKMMYEGSHPKGFGFVCFATQEEAQLAVTQMNGRIVGSKPLYVTYAQKKEDRKAFLAKKYKEMGETGHTASATPLVIPSIPPPVKSPNSLPPTSPIATPQQTFYPMQTSPQNIHYQYYPAGHVVSPQLPWNPVPIQPVRMTQPYYSPQTQYNPIQVAPANDSNAMQTAPAFMWTGAPPNTGYHPYQLQQSTTAQTATLHAGPNYMPPQNVYPGQQVPVNTLPSNIMTVQNYPKVIEQANPNTYHIQQQ